MFVIYISGIDGCGKTTQARRLAEWLRAKGVNAGYQWLRWEPSILALIRLARRSLDLFSRKQILPQREQVGAENISTARWGRFKSRILGVSFARKLWLSYATRDYLRAYRRAARKWTSDCIVLDRYLFDFVVDQSLNLQIPVLDFLRFVDSSPLRAMRKPDLSVFIHLPAETAHKRKSDGTSMRYLESRAGAYREIPAGPDVLHIDGAKEMDAVHEEIAGWIASRIPKVLP